MFIDVASRNGVTINNPKIQNISHFKLNVSKYHIKLIIFNLIDNAIKYSFASTKRNERSINIVCFSQTNELCVQVTNCGIGFLPQEISEGLIFKEGYRGQLIKDFNIKGSGSGLAIAKRVLEDQGGRIEVESEEAEYLKIESDPQNPYITKIKIYLPII